MLVKANSAKYVEDFGLRSEDQVYLYYQCTYGDDWGENVGPVAASKLSLSPVIRVNALWVNKNLKVTCHVADTLDKKATGLQEFEKLDTNEGMYFPYSPYGEFVTFHQANVPFGLDLIFLRDDRVIQIEADTKVGSKERWTCDGCSGVIEVNAGFCFENDVNVGDKIALFAVSELDERKLAKEYLALEKEEFEIFSNSNFYYLPNAVNLISAIADGL